MGRRREHPPMHFPLTSAGEATAARAYAERVVAPVVTAVVDDFLAETLDLAMETIAPRPMTYAGAAAMRGMSFAYVYDPIIAAGPQPFTLGGVLGAWSRAAQAMADSVAWLLPTQVQDRYLARTLAALLDTPFASQAYSAAQAVMSAGRDRGESVRTTAKALRTTLRLDNGAVVSPPTTASPGLQTTGYTWGDTAARIARTTATGAYNTGALVTLSEAGHEYKTWVAHHDSHTRATHLAADGLVVAITDPFIVGGYAMQAPGDYNAPAAETANCRCVVTGVA